jgi:hypothetical protein
MTPVYPQAIRPGDFLVFEDGQCKEVESCEFDPDLRPDDDDGFGGWSSPFLNRSSDPFYRVALLKELSSGQRVFDLKPDGRLHHEDPRRVPRVKMLLRGAPPIP